MVSREEEDANESRRDAFHASHFSRDRRLGGQARHLPWQASTMATLSYATDLMFPAATQAFIQFLRQNIIPPGDAGYTVHSEYYYYLSTALHRLLVCGRVRERSRREAKLVVGGVVHGVEPLEEREAVDEVKTLPRVAAEVRNNEVHAVVVAADGRVQLEYYCSEPEATAHPYGYVPPEAKFVRWG